MNLTKLIRNLENKLKASESLARRYDAEAAGIRKRLAVVARLLGRQLELKLTARLGGGGISAAGRARIAAAQRKRWAKFRGKAGRKAAPKSKRTRRLSAAGRANIIAAQKKRWAAARTRKQAGKNRRA